MRVISLLALGIAVSNPASAQNLFTNGSFNSSIAGWSVDSNFGTLTCQHSEKDSAVVTAQSGSMKCNFTAPSIAFVRSAQCIGLEPFGTYVFKANVVSLGALTGFTSVNLGLYENADCTGIGSFYPYLFPGTSQGWENYAFVFRNDPVPAFGVFQPWKSAALDFTVAVGSGQDDGGGYTAWIDGVSLERAVYDISDSTAFSGCRVSSLGDQLCLNGHRFKVTTTWEDFQHNIGSGKARPLTNDSGTFWFFNEENVELNVKVLDACLLGGHFWVFSSASTNVGVVLEVTDLATGRVKRYDNPLGHTYSTITDTSAFPCN